MNSAENSSTTSNQTSKNVMFYRNLCNYFEFKVKNHIRFFYKRKIYSTFLLNKIRTWSNKINISISDGYKTERICEEIKIPVPWGFVAGNYNFALSRYRFLFDLHFISCN